MDQLTFAGSLVVAVLKIKIQKTGGMESEAVKEVSLGSFVSLGL